MFSLLGLPYLYIYTKRREEEEEREAHSWFRTIKSGLHGEIEESLFFLFKTPPQRRESTAAGPFVVALFKRRRPPADIFKSAKGAVVNARCQNRQHFFKRVTWPPSPVVLFSSGGATLQSTSPVVAQRRGQRFERIGGSRKPIAAPVALRWMKRGGFGKWYGSHTSMIRFNSFSVFTDGTR